MECKLLGVERECGANNYCVLHRSANISLMPLKTTNMDGFGSAQVEETTACIAMLSLLVLY